VVNGRVVATVRAGSHFDVIPPAGVDWASARDEAALERQCEEQEQQQERQRQREQENWEEWVMRFRGGGIAGGRV
jgi:hypothetical protein